MKIEVTEEDEDLVELTFLLGNIIHAGKSVSCRDIAECVLRAGYVKNNFEKAEFLEILEKDLLNVAHSLGGSAQFRARLEDSFKKLLEKYRGE